MARDEKDTRGDVKCNVKGTLESGTLITIVILEVTPSGFHMRGLK
jgi:hypothetical protein